jgi:multisubunit Na+/H+ antiporter MnhB subunit
MKRKLSIIITILMIGMLGVIVSGLTFGNPVDHPMDRYFIENSQQQSGANNVVTAVLFDYRGFDTLGEAAVLFTAALGASLVLRRRRDD